jgi:hypothetical protein
MSFIGIPVIQKVTDTCFRITGVSLAPLTQGTIGFQNPSSPAEVQFVAPNWQPYARPGGPSGDVVGLVDVVECEVVAASGGNVTQIPLGISKAGNTQSNFEITVTNGNGAQGTPSLEIYVSLGGH